MKYVTEVDFVSTIDPSISYKLRKISHNSRGKLTESIMPIITRMQELEKESEPLQEEITRAEEAAKIEPCTCKHDLTSPKEWDQENLIDGFHLLSNGRCIKCDCRKPVAENDAYRKMNDINVKYSNITRYELWPARIRAVVKKIEGLEIDDKVADVDLLLESGPEGLVFELANKATSIIQMSHDEQMAFKSLGIGSAPVAGENNTNAPAV